MPPARNVPAPVARRGVLRRLVLAGAATAAAAAVLLPTAAAADTGTTTTLTGQLVQTWADSEHEEAAHAAGAEAPQSFVTTPDGATVPVDTADVADVPLGATVSVTVPGTEEQVTEEATTGDAVNPVLGSTVVKDPAPVPAVPARRFTNEVTIAVVTPAGATPDGTTAEQLAELVDDEVAGFWAEQTDGAVRIGVTAAHDGVATTAGCASAATLWTEVAAKVKFTSGPGKHLLVHLPRSLTSCQYALAEVGRAPASGGRIYVREAEPSVIAHELGHNFGLGHSSGRQCDAAVDTGTCRTAPYRDFYDVMGVSWGKLGSLNALQAARLQVLPAVAQQHVSVHGSATTATLSPLSGRSGTRALRLADAAGTEYWLEYRPATGRDAWLESDGNRYGLESGVLVRRSGAFPDTSLLLDGTPAASPRWNADRKSALPVGAAVALADGQFSVVVQEVTAAGAVVHVVPTPPAVAPAPAPVEAGAGAGQVLAGAPGAAAGGGAPAPVTVPPAEPGVAAGSAPVEAGASPASPVLSAATETTNRGGMVLAAAGALLAGGLLLVVRRVRKSLLIRMW